MIGIRVEVDNTELCKLPTTKHFIPFGERSAPFWAWRNAVEIDPMLITYTGQKLRVR
jgi:hypothetical protein